MSDRWRTALGLAAVWWLTAFFVGYFYTHKPFTFGLLPGLGRLALTLAAWLGTLATAHTLGNPLERLIRGAALRDRFALRLGLGLGVLGLIVLAMGALGLYRPAVTWVMLLIGAAVGFRSFVRETRGLLPRVPAGSADRCLAAFVVISLGLSFLAALAPPTAWDSLVYHLTGPKLYIAAGRLHQDIDLPYLGFPHWPAMLYTWALLLADPAGAQLIHFTFALLTLALLPGLVAQVAPGRAWLAAALLLSAPALTLLAGWAYVEWMTMFAVAAGITALLNWRRSGEGRWLAITGAFAGLAFAAKYTAAGAILGLGLAALLASFDKGAADESKLVRASLPGVGLVFGGAALLVAAPWLLKNLILTGNPVYPFFFPGKFWDAFRAEWYSRPGTGLNLLRTLAAPWSLMVTGTREDDVGPLLPALPLLLVIGWTNRMPESRRVVWLMVAACLAALAVWMAGLAGSRLLVQYRPLFPIFPLVAVLGTAAFDGLEAASSSALRPRWVIGGLIGLALALNLGSRLLSFVGEDPLPAALGLQDRRDYLIARLGAYALAMEAVNDLPPGHRVVFLWEPRSFYCSDGCEPDAILDRWWHLRRTVGNAGTIAARWRSEGVTHVLLFETGRDFVEREGFDPFTADDWAELNRLIADDLALTQDLNEAYRLYALKP